MTDVRDALAWAQEGGLAEALKDREEGVEVDGRRVMVMGTSSGGHLALSTVCILLFVKKLRSYG
jgi:acetyl esterase/lipase